MASYTPSYPIPSKRDQAYILLVLAIGTVKRFFTELNSFNEFDEKTQDRLLDIAENIIHGKEESNKFISEFEKALKKEVPGIKLDDNCKTLILQRLDSSKGSSRSTSETKTSTEKETNKKVDKKGTLKESTGSYQYIHIDLYTGVVSSIPGNEVRDATIGVDEVKGSMFPTWKTEEYMVIKIH